MPQPQPVGRRRLGRPTQSEAAEMEERLKQAALDLFLDRGYDGTTMEAVAQKAGITRRTLYARYAHKSALFVDVITWARTRLPWDEPEFTVDRSDLRAALVAIARSAVHRAIDPQLVDLDRIVIHEWKRFPDLVLFGRRRPLSPRHELVMEVLSWHADAHAIEVGDIEMTAEQFLAMVTLLPARLASVGVRRSWDVEERHIQNAVDLFVRALQPGPS